MPNPPKGARLYIYRRKGREPQYIIRHTGRPDVFTGFGLDQSEAANKRLHEYLAEHFRPDTSKRDLAAISIGEVLDLYMTDIGPRRTPNSRATLGYHVTALLSFWGDKSLADVRGSTCREYVAKRTVRPATARLELKDLQTAINHWKKESPLSAVPQVTLPPPGVPRERFLERREVAAMLGACRKLKLPHVARFIIIGVYSGTRHSAITSLHWSGVDGQPHISTAKGIIFRKGAFEAETSKRRPPFRIGKRLLSFVRLWERTAGDCSRVIHYNGLAVAKMKRAWRSVIKEAGLGPEVTPHVLRHTFITWELWKGTSIWDVAGMAGSSATMIERVYGHHRPIEQQRKTA